jgi:hypothetical protein
MASDAADTAARLKNVRLLQNCRPLQERFIAFFQIQPPTAKYLQYLLFETFYGILSSPGIAIVLCGA